MRLPRKEKGEIVLENNGLDYPYPRILLSEGCERVVTTSSRAQCHFKVLLKHSHCVTRMLMDTSQRFDR